MFSVFWDKHSWDGGVGRPFTVYNVRDDKSGYPHFLLYYDGQWFYVSAKHCTPVL